METGFRPVGLGADPIPWRGFLHCLAVMATFVGNLDNNKRGRRISMFGGVMPGLLYLGRQPEGKMVRQSVTSARFKLQVPVLGDRPSYAPASVSRLKLPSTLVERQVCGPPASARTARPMSELPSPADSPAAILPSTVRLAAAVFQSERRAMRLCQRRHDARLRVDRADSN
jgi:hypothetical protein